MGSFDECRSHRHPHRQLYSDFIGEILLSKLPRYQRLDRLGATSEKIIVSRALLARNIPRLLLIVPISLDIREILIFHIAEYDGRGCCNFSGLPGIRGSRIVQRSYNVERATVQIHIAVIFREPIAMIKYSRDNRST